MIWKIAIKTTSEAEDAVSELLSTIFKERASSYTNIETEVVTVAVYCERPVGLVTKRATLRAGISQIKNCGLNVGASRVSVRRIRREDWANSWKRHFKPIEIGRALLIKPSWSKRRTKRNQVVVVLDPGLSFGTGQHPTTAFCLRELVRQQRAGEQQSFLDIGTGSGILAIAAAKLNYSPIYAFDFDPEAVRVAQANARTNGVVTRLEITRADISKFSAWYSRQYDLICANLISTLLIAERQRIARLLHPGGVLVLAGILKTEFHKVQSAYKLCGLQLIASEGKGEWRSGTFSGNFHSRV